MEQDDTSSCGSLSPLWSSNEDNIITLGDERAEACEHVQVPDEEPSDELNTFLMEHRYWICSLIQADWPALRLVLKHPRPRVEDGGVPEHVPQQPQDTVDRHPQA